MVKGVVSGASVGALTLAQAASLLAAERVRLTSEIKARHVEIERARSEVQTLKAGPVSLPDYVDHLRKYVDSCGRRWLATHHPRDAVWDPVERGYGGVPANLISFSDLVPDDGESGTPYVVPSRMDFTRMNQAIPGDDPFSMMCYFFPEVVSKKMADTFVSELSEVWGNEDAIPSAKRVEIISKNDALIARLESEVVSLEGELAALN